MEKELRHNVGRGRGEEDSVSEMAGREEVTGVRHNGAQQRETIQSGRTKPRPSLKDRGAGEFGKQERSFRVKTSDRSSIDCLIETLVFDRCTDESQPLAGSLGTRHDIQLRGSDHYIEGERRR